MSHFWRYFGYVLCSLGIIATLILAPFTIGISLIGTVIFAVTIWKIKKSGEMATMNKNLGYIADRERRLDKELAETERKYQEKQRNLEANERLEAKQKQLDDLRKKAEDDTNTEDNKE